MRLRSSVRPCAWNRVRERESTKVSARSRGCCVVQPLNAHFLSSHPLSRINVMWRKKKKESIHYLNIHLNLSSTSSSSTSSGIFCRVNHQLKKSNHRSCLVPPVKCQQHLLLQDESVNVCLPFRQDPIRCCFSTSDNIPLCVTSR